ncbi:MAG TPA: CoA transferase [Dehalococcoidia bacterium]|nr:CoA transferase [Dehalococcoidia bacterium]
MPLTPLDGVRVLDLTHYIAGPYCTKLLADFGAQVIKIERPPAGDPARRIGPFFHDEPSLESSALFLHLNTNKQSLTLNLKSAEGNRIVRRLLVDTDILVENFRPGVLANLGLNYVTLKAINPAIILTSISNFGQTGPYRDLKASEIVESAMGGPMNITGHAHREPLKLGGNVVQYHAGAIAAYATVMALLRAEDQGAGDWIDVSIYETQCTNRDRRVIYLLGHAYTGELGKRQVFGHRALSGVRQAADGYVSLVGAGTRLPGLLRIMGREDLLEDPRVQEAIHHTSAEVMEEIEALYLEWLRGQPKHKVVAEAQAAHVLAAPVNTIADLFSDPHFAERSPWSVIESPVTGPIAYPGPPFRMSASPAPAPSRAPMLGEHNTAILCDRLGYEREDLRRLAEQGVI